MEEKRKDGFNSGDQKDGVFSNRIGQYQVPQTKSKEEAWAAFSNDVNEPVTRVLPEVKNRGLVLTLASSAAAVLIFISLHLLFLVKLEVPLGLKDTIHLSDNSGIILNSGSEISYSKILWALKKRSLKFEGEGLFIVAKGSKFSVNTPYGDIEVLGTEFNLYARNKEFEVQCVEGSVRAISETGDEVVLKAGEAVVLIEQGRKFAEIESFRIENKANWIRGSFEYREAKLSRVLEEVERQFDVDIESADFSSRRYTGAIDMVNLEDVLEMICVPMNLNYELVNESNVRILEN